MSRLITIVASMGGVAFLFLGFTWGEGLLSQEYIMSKPWKKYCYGTSQQALLWLL
jgi:hypothetical protein